MNDDDMSTRFRDDELTRRLRTYATDALAPDPDAMAAIRADLLERIASTTAGPATAAEDLGLPPTRRVTAAPRAGTSSRAWRRLGLGLAAASLAVLAIGGVAAAAQPNGPLYGPRLWLETVTLPSDPAARTDTDVQRLTERLAEVDAAAAAHDSGALAAALAAYSDVLDDAFAAAGDDPGRLAELETVLQRHLMVLRGLLATVPSQATDAITRAIDRSSSAVDRINDGQGPGGNPAGTGGNGGNGNESPASSGAPAGSHATHSSAPSGSTATPTASHGPSQSPPGKPSQSPPGKPSQSPPGGPSASPSTVPSPDAAASSKPDKIPKP